jgi:Putative peptidoglycan binding domain
MEAFSLCFRHRHAEANGSSKRHGVVRKTGWLALLVGLLLAAGLAYWLLGERRQPIAPPPLSSSPSPPSAPTTGAPAAPEAAPPAPPPQATGPTASPPPASAAPEAAPPAPPPQTAGPTVSSPPPTAAAPLPQPAPTPPPLATTPAPLPAEAGMSAADRRQIQEALRRLDYYRGPVDGVLGRGTRAAIRRFQQRIGAQTTGRLTAEQANLLVSIP